MRMHMHAPCHHHCKHAFTGELLRIFDWFGSYMLEETVGEEEGGAEGTMGEEEGAEQAEAPKSARTPTSAAAGAGDAGGAAEPGVAAGSDGALRPGGSWYRGEGESFLDRMKTAPLMLDRKRRVTYVVHTK